MNWDLLSKADYVDTIVFGILFIVFIVVFLFMKRLQFGEVAMGTANVTPADDAPQQIMTKVKNPFVIQLTHPAQSTLKDGVSIKLTSQVPCWIKAFWGVNIEDIYPIIYSAWIDFSEKFSSSNFFNGSSIVQEEMFEPTAVSGKVVFFKPELECGDENKELALGEPPRSCYPLVLFIVDANSLEMDPEDLIPFQQVTSCITILHVRDSLCPAETNIISQFIRTPAGRPFDLKPLFVSDEEEASPMSNYNEPSSPSTLKELPSSRSTCVVCQTAPVTRAILPCRHAALCDLCFSRMSLCPMCRGPISAYFTLNEMNIDDDTNDE